MQSVSAHRLVAVLGDELLPGLVTVRPQVAAAEQELVGLSAPLDDVASQVVPEPGLHDRERPHLRAFREDRQPLARVVEVPELDQPQRLFPQRIGEQQP